MSKDEIRQLIGEPHHVLNDALTGGRDEWVYVYGIPKDSAPSPDYLFAFRSVAYFVGYIGTVAAAVYRGRDIRCSGYSDSAPNGNSRGSPARIWRFRVVFDKEGSVCEVEDVW